MAWLRSFVGMAIFGIAATATLAQSTSQIDRTNWKLYRNDKFGFEMKYPGTWSVSMSTGSRESIILHAPQEAGKPNRLLQFFVQRGINPNGLSIDKWYSEQLKRFKAPRPPTIDTVLGGRPTIRRTVEGTLGRYFDFFTSVNKTDVFQISIIQDSSQAQLNPTYKSILSTVRFIH